MLILGIDDAGRGPVIGPMIMAGCLIDDKIEKEFRKLGVKDSKLLQPKKREALAEIIRDKAITFEVRIIHPAEIDGRDGDGLNLNKIEAIKSAEIINAINEGFKQMKVIIDCPSPNITSWKNYLLKHIEKKDNLIVMCEHKADRNHIACGAASIIAKSTREAEVQKIKDKLGIDFGSGYTHDPITIKFLKDYHKKYKKDGIFRETWGTIANHKAEKEQKKLDSF